MPTYEYECDACNHTFDEFQSFSEKPLEKCPQCGELKLRRLFGTGAAVIFKGSGFYETDYRSESYKKAAKAEQEASQSTNGQPTDKANTTETASNNSSSEKTSFAGKSSKSED